MEVNFQIHIQDKVVSVTMQLRFLEMADLAVLLTQRRDSNLFPRKFKIKKSFYTILLKYKIMTESIRSLTESIRSFSTVPLIIYFQFNDLFQRNDRIDSKDLVLSVERSYSFGKIIVGFYF